MHRIAILAFVIFFGFLGFATSYSAPALPTHVFKQYKFADECDSKIEDLLHKASTLAYQHPQEARPFIVQAFDLAQGGAPLDEYNYTYALYLLIRTSFTSPDSTAFVPGTREDFLKISRRLFEHLGKDASLGSFIFTEVGQFSIEAYVTAGNGLAWELYEAAGTDKKALDEALTIIQATTRFANDPKYFYARDTEVRILLALGRAPEAYQIVRDTLKEMPGFSDFHDINLSSTYKKWLEQQQ